MSENQDPINEDCFVTSTYTNDTWTDIRKVRVNKENESVSIYLPMGQLSPDRVQYKPYGMGYSVNHIYVEVTIPLSEVVHYYKDQDIIVLTPRGSVMIADQLASAIEENYNEFRGRSKTF